MVDDRLYFRQLLAGRDFAIGDPVARQMVNFVYLLGDRVTGEALVVDPAYAVGEIVDAAASDGMAVTGALVTHYHADHVGGALFGHDIEGVAALLEAASVPVHANREEGRWIARSAGVAETDLVLHDSGDTVSVGAVDVVLVHTPGHTPGSQCFLVEGRLVSGDTLFLDGCGRTDLPGSDPDAMYDSLRRLAGLAPATTVYPGHRYSEASAATIGVLVDANVALRPLERQAWRDLFSPL